MPLISAPELRRRTHITISSRGQRMEDLITALALYHTSPTLVHLEDLWAKFDLWKFGHPNWKQDRRNLVPGMNRPLEELDTELRSLFRETARAALNQAVRAIIHVYGAKLDPVYHKALLDTFVNNTNSATLPCFVWFRKSNLWQTRLVGSGWKPAQGVTNGLTVAEKPADILNYNAWIKQQNFATNLELVGEYQPSGTSAPGDRFIQVNTLDHHTLTHEMLHWCTHATFENISHTQYQGHIGTLIREGITEWLTREALQQPNTGGYTDLVPITENVVTRIKLDSLFDAYFKGLQVKAFCDGFKSEANKNADFKAAEKRMLLAAFNQ